MDLPLRNQFISSLYSDNIVSMKNCILPILLLIALLILGCSEGKPLPEDWKVFESGKKNIFRLTEDEFVSEPVAIICRADETGYAYAQSPDIRGISFKLPYTVEFSILLADHNHQNVELFNNGPIRLFIDFRGRIKAGDSADPKPADELKIGIWQKVRVQVRPEQKEYDIYINDKPIDRFRLSDKQPYAGFRLGITPDDPAAHGTCYWDDIIISQEKNKVILP
jgi:hypothetical protein